MSTHNRRRLASTPGTLVVVLETSAHIADDSEFSAPLTIDANVYIHTSKCLAQVLCSIAANLRVVIP